MAEVVDADAHAVEGASFAGEALRRWPEKMAYRPRPGGGGDFWIEGRRYPEFEGPGAGCPPEHGLCREAGIEPESVEGMLRDADREGIDRMVLFPSMGLATPGLVDLRFAAAFARLYNQWIAEWCAKSDGRLLGVAVTPIEDVEVSVEILGEAKRAGLVCVHVPPALRTRNLDHPELERFWAAAADLELPIGVHGAPGVHLP
jgi:predicted TIM-barrel fold metal-dependent hydrolase